MPEFSSSKIMTHHLHVDNAQGYDGISYYMIICHELMVQIGLKANFGRKILEWEKTLIPMKDQGNFLGQPDLTKCEI